MIRDTTQRLSRQAEKLVASKKYSAALLIYDRIISLSADNADALHSRGILLAEMGRYREALLNYDRCLSLRPDFAVALRNRGAALYFLGEYEEAVISYSRSLEMRPDHVETLCVRSMVFSEMGRINEALTDLNLALGIRPNFFPAMLERANLLSRLKRLEEALIAYNRALPFASDKSDIYSHIGHILIGLQRFVEAFSAFSKALELSNHNASALVGRGDLLRLSNRADEAIQDYTRCIEIRSHHKITALVNRGLSHWENKGNPERAISDFESALDLDPNYPYLRGTLLHAKLQCAVWSNLTPDIEAINHGVRTGQRVVLPFVYQAISQSQEDSQKCARILARDCFPYDPMPAPTRRTHNKRKRLRIGYSCGEFKEHATSHLMAGLYEKHDRVLFEIVAIDNGINDGSLLRKRLESSFDELLSIRGISDNDAAQKVRDAEIDILVKWDPLESTCRHASLSIL